jgi:hypothetical protein
MSDILKMANDMAKDLHSVGALDQAAAKMMDELCLPKARKEREPQVSQAALGNDLSSTR